MERYNMKIESTKGMRDYTYQWDSSWDHDDPEVPILKISKSSLGTFRICPLQYYKRYFERKPSDVTAAMLKGTVIHDAKEDYYKSFELAKAEPLEGVELETYFHSMFPIDVDQSINDQYNQIITFELDRFKEARDEETLSEFLPIGNELQGNSEIVIMADENENFTLNRNYTVHMMGIIDRIYRDGDDVVPVELKTGPWKDNKASSMRKEMAYYKLLMESDPAFEDMLPVTQWGWWYPASGVVHIEKCTRYSRAMESTKKDIAAILYCYENDDWPAHFVYQRCPQWCSFVGECDKAKMEIGGWI
jgi:hypothetical protein